MNGGNHKEWRDGSEMKEGIGEGGVPNLSTEDESSGINSIMIELAEECFADASFGLFSQKHSSFYCNLTAYECQLESVYALWKSIFTSKP